MRDKLAEWLKSIGTNNVLREQEMPHWNKIAGVNGETENVRAMLDVVYSNARGQTICLDVTTVNGADVGDIGDCKFGL